VCSPQGIKTLSADAVVRESWKRETYLLENSGDSKKSLILQGFLERTSLKFDKENGFSFPHNRDKDNPTQLKRRGKKEESPILGAQGVCDKGYFRGCISSEKGATRLEEKRLRRETKEAPIAEKTARSGRGRPPENPLHLWEMRVASSGEKRRGQ